MTSNARPPQQHPIFDVFVIGGGINGAGIARDAAGRGLAVGLCERADFANATSSASSKLIHGGLRYLEQYEFKLVAEALAERERLLTIAPHIAWPMRFVLPHEPHLRPAWMLRAGLFLYDHLHVAYGVRRSLPGSHGIKLDTPTSPLQARLTRGFEYSDAWVDDARLTILNIMDAQQRGASIFARTEFVSAAHDGTLWHLTLKNTPHPSDHSNTSISLGGSFSANADSAAPTVTVQARTVVNAGGPWVKQVAQQNQLITQDRVQLVKGSHLIVPRQYAGEQAYILQQPDGRIVFVIPYEQRFTLIGTTDLRVGMADLNYAMLPSDAEVDYMLAAANRYLAKPVAKADIIHSYAGVRPLYDDGSDNPSQTTRDYTLKLQHHWLDIFGGKITTYRYLAQEALDKLRPALPHMGKHWSASAPLPGGDIGAFEPFFTELSRQYPQLPPAWLRSAAHRHGSNIHQWLGKDLGADIGGGLMQAEADYLQAKEWAHTLDDMLWRRTKCGLHAKAGLVQ
jgi:glycerol-3-phosphate dehydrogenase